MSRWQLILGSLLHHWRINVAVALGVAAATAVLTGALLVGDSVRGSLRHLTLDRLGRIDEVLVTDRFFRSQLVDELNRSEDVRQDFDQAVPAILFPHATVQQQGGDTRARAAGVLVVGCDESFWQLDVRGVRPRQLPAAGQIVINQAVADEWGAGVGDRVVLRLPKGNQVPADSPLAKKTGRVHNIAQLEVVDVIPTEGLGRFSLRPSQSLPRNVYVARETLQNSLRQPGKINAVLVSLREGIDPLSDRARQASRRLTAALSASLADYGLSIERIRQVFSPPGNSGEEVVFDYFSLTTDRMILAPEAEEVAARAFAPLGGQPLLTYLANSITRDGHPGEIPYSTVTAIDVTEHFDLRAADGAAIGPLGDDQIVLNSWAAEQLQAQPGDRIRLAYFAPETTHGKAVEQVAEFTLRAVTPLTEPSQPFRRQRPAVFTRRPTLANDPHLTPEVEGVTDQETIRNWDPPFPYDQTRVRPADEDYWDHYRTTPKAFISLEAGRRLWGSRFGQVTSYRIPAADGLTVRQLEDRFLAALADSGHTLGFDFIPVKRRQLEASKGTTPFDALFLALSFFIIAAALMLVALLFRLGIEQRAGEIGILLASGFRRRLVARLLVVEGALVAADGAGLGVIVGVAYAWLMLAGLRTFWVGAITTPFLQFHYSVASLVLGYVAGVVVSVVTIAWSVWRTRRVSVRRLLAGQASDAGSYAYRPSSIPRIVAVALIALALGLLVYATQLVAMAQAGAFVGGGAALLTGLLLLIWARLKAGGRAGASALAGPLALAALALRNAARNPSRSAITIALMATASFLIVAMSSFRMEPSAAGTGGFDLLAESAEPVFEDLNDPQDRRAVLAERAGLLEGGVAFGLRLRPGDDASCNNLYQSTQPRVIGVSPAFVEYFDRPEVQRFGWAGTKAEHPEQKRNPWRLLQKGAADDDEVPVILDMNTAMYSLKVGLGGVYQASYDGGEPIRFRVVGLLDNSVLQGSLLISERQFQRVFPEIGGYRYFLIRSPPGNGPKLAAALEDRWGDEGFDAVETRRVLAQFLAVQNTYLSTFQSLGALGLLLGTFGLATVQLRNVVERRGELALLRATGFRRRTLARLVLWENIVLLMAGLATGVSAALLAVLPHKFLGQASLPNELLRDLAVMLAVVLAAGILASFAAVKVALKTPVLAALRGD